MKELIEKINAEYEAFSKKQNNKLRKEIRQQELEQEKLP